MANAAPEWFERPLTHRDLDDLPEDDRFRYEVIDGELYKRVAVVKGGETFSPRLFPGLTVPLARLWG